MTKFKFGDYVIYDPGYKQEIGRVTQVRKNTAFVCYGAGCTAAATPLEYLRPATQAEIDKVGNGYIGYHRFDAKCPEYDHDMCHAYCPDKEPR